MSWKESWINLTLIYWISGTESAELFGWNAVWLKSFEQMSIVNLRRICRTISRVLSMSHNKILNQKIITKSRKNIFLISFIRIKTVKDVSWKESWINLTLIYWISGTESAELFGWIAVWLKPFEQMSIVNLRRICRLPAHGGMIKHEMMFFTLILYRFRTWTSDSVKIRIESIPHQNLRENSGG